MQGSNAIHESSLSLFEFVAENRCQQDRDRSQGGLWCVQAPKAHTMGKMCSEVERLEVQMVAEAQLWNLYGIVGLSKCISFFLEVKLWGDIECFVRVSQSLHQDNGSSLPFHFRAT